MTTTKPTTPACLLGGIFLLGGALLQNLPLLMISMYYSMLTVSARLIPEKYLAEEIPEVPDVR